MGNQLQNISSNRFCAYNCMTAATEKVPVKRQIQGNAKKVWYSQGHWSMINIARINTYIYNSHYELVTTVKTRKIF